jgi:hypothetical protein
LVERIELAAAEGGPDGPDQPIVVGFRHDGSLSVYFGGDPVYQFNAANELRRAFCDGQMFKAERGRLVRLDRVRQQAEVQLVRHELSAAEEAGFVEIMRHRLCDLAGRLDARRIAVVGQVPADADILGRVRQWLAAHDGLPIARTPHVRAK